MLGINKVTITPSLMQSVAAIDEFKGLWTGLERHTTALNLLGDVAAYKQDFYKTLLDLQEKRIDLDMVRALYIGLTQDTNAGFRDADMALDIPGEDGAVGEIETASPEEIEPLLSKLLDWVDGVVSSDQPKTHPLLAISVFASVFLQVAPFPTLNFKVLRMLIVIYLLKSGYGYVPYVLLDPIMERRGGEILKALKVNQASLEAGRPDWSAWLECFLGILGEQKDILRGRLLSEKKDLSHLPALSAKIMALFETHKRLSMKEIIKLTNGRRATIKLRLSELLEAGYLKRYGQARSTWYALD